LKRDALRHKVLAIAEEEGAKRAAYGLKLLPSDGKISIASTGKDAAGRMVTETYEVEGPVALFTTTTSIDIDDELLNRCIELTVDEGRAQTRSIHDRQRHAETLGGMLGKRRGEQLIALHRNAQRLLEATTASAAGRYASALGWATPNSRSTSGASSRWSTSSSTAGAAASSTCTS
jgi:hypothetical protein